MLDPDDNLVFQDVSFTVTFKPAPPDYTHYSHVLLLPSCTICGLLVGDLALHQSWHRLGHSRIEGL